MEIGILGLILILAVLSIAVVSIAVYLKKKKSNFNLLQQNEEKSSSSSQTLSNAHEFKIELDKAVEAFPPTPTGESKPLEESWQERLKKGLGRSRQEVWGKVISLFSTSEIKGEQWDEIEELLYSADVGPKMAQDLLEYLKNKVKGTELTPEKLKSELHNFLKSRLENVQMELDPELFHFKPIENRPFPKTIMIVGVNGVGKTTTIGKLATKLTEQGAKVVVGACDTFRAAAVDQLQVWCDRSGATMVRAKEGSAPSGVGYQALERAIQLKADYCLLDTAGRLHTKENLMDELKKSKNVLSKLDPSAPHHVLLVLDAITGQNALRQAQEFHKTLSLTGLIFTKCDGSSKAGSALGIMQDLKVPISYIGVGEGVKDLNEFKLDDYLLALLGQSAMID